MGLVQVSTSPDIQIYYTVDGPLDGSRPVIALSNSLAATTRLWDDFVTEFSSKYTILRYDPRFHGQSPQASDPNFDYSKGHTIEDLASDFVKILDHLKITRLEALIGLSIGAAVALVVGAQHPDRVNHVFVIGTKAEASPEAEVAHDKRIAYGRANGPLAAGRQSVGRWFSEKYIAENPDKAAFVESVVGGQTVDGLEANIVALRKLNLWPYAEDVGKRGDGKRFIFVAGEQDGTIPQESKELAAKAGSEVVIIPGIGHIVNVQAPEEFYKIVRKNIA